jgi:hypothetical protein
MPSRERLKISSKLSFYKYHSGKKPDAKEDADDKYSAA